MDTAKSNGHKRAVLYARVSTDEQAETGYSLTTQVEACEKYADIHGFDVVGVFRDDYTGTTPIEQRPEGRKVYDVLASGAADVLIAYRVDRIVRPPEEGDEWDMPSLIRGLSKLGKELHTVNRGQLKTDFASLLIAMLDAKGAGDERRAIIERTTRGKNGKVSAGKVLCAGPSPYGYRFNAGRDQMVIDEREARIVRQMYTWYTAGDSDGVPLVDFAIAQKLSEMGIQTPGERMGFVRQRSTGIWNSVTVSRILTDEVYAGVWRYRKTDTHGKPRPIDQQIAVEVPAIVPRVLWQAAQARREYNKQMSKRNCKHDYLLRGRVTCNCGRAMTGCFSISGAGNFYYRCTCANNFYRGLEQRLCTQRMVRCDLLDTTAWNYILDIFSDRERYEQALQEAQELERQAMRPKQDELAAVLDSISELETEADRLSVAITRTPGGIVGASIQKQIDAVNAKYDRQCKKRERLTAELSAQALTDEEIDTMLHFRDDVAMGLQNPTFEDKRRYLEYLDVKIKIKGEEAHFSCRLPVSGRTIRIPCTPSL